ncbi:ATP-dependent helicase [Corynebacterium atypicum]|uniref:DNA 5'-3' helicase n=1 Tax=Corynebacterium atypicum TaxID=191610 RepID=A0ABN4DDS0_9CORY|nr:ATP-dependent DNA helicase [Corynebacterium atypicum]AIG64605.1 ATP-dependent helicase [Corynebacterium atypicum]
MASDAPVDGANETEALLAAAVTALGGARRDGQVAMADAVAHAIDARRHLAVQAGTGTGKSLAYLVPALIHAQRNEETVVVSTATIALQRQLVERDLPRLAEALADKLPHRPTFAIQKGRGNYVCLQKISAAERSTADPADKAGAALLDKSDLSWLERQVSRVRQWAADTETGDREDLEPGVPDSVWRQVSVASKECLGRTRCPHGDECFAELARARTADVDVVVTNHALLAIDALADQDVLPPHEVVIVDEAHELDGRITAVATEQLTVSAVKQAISRAEKLPGQEAGKLTQAAEVWAEHAPQLVAGRLTHVDSHTRTLLVALRDELWALGASVGTTPEGESASEPDRYAERMNLANHLSELHDAVVRMLTVFDVEDATAQEDVVWLEVDERRSPALTVAPLSVAELLAGNLFAANTVVLTSATLALGGKFSAMAAGWGLARGTWDALDVGTPFNPAKAAILYVARHLPDPGRAGLAPETLEEIYRLIMAAGGRTLGLFSSRRAAAQAAEELRPRLPMPVLLQGEDATGVLVDKFANDENSCLFGTLTLWQGVDVPGASLSQVIIDRIPFPRPDDPLLQARKEAADAAGRSGFMEVAATHAALLLAQGTGRLVRSVDDRGVISVLDRRLVTKRYGGYLRASLPKYWETTDPQVVAAALRRLTRS